MKTLSSFKRLALIGVALVAAPSWAMVSLEESEMSEVSGTGLAFVMDNFSMRMAPTSYAEITGTPPTAQSAAKGWQRGDARYYGLSFTSSAATGIDWYGNGCDTGSDSALRCPLGVTGTSNFGVAAFASAFDPFLLRVSQYKGYNHQGAWLESAAEMPTILEFIGPSNTDAWRWSFWGELEIDRQIATAAFGTCNSSSCGPAGAKFLQSQTIINGRPNVLGFAWKGLNAAGVDQGYQTASDPEYKGRKPSILRLMQSEMAGSQPTLGITYQSALSGDFRFSVRQQAGSPDALHDVPDFNNNEGLHFKNVEAFLPLGTLHYQALTFSGVSSYNPDTTSSAPTQNGNFTIELTRIPNTANIYNNFYCGSTDGTVCAQTAQGYIAAPNPDTHGYVRWGNWCTTAACTAVINPAGVQGAGPNQLPTATSTANGIYFVGGGTGSTPANNVTNLGISRVEGMLIQHLKLTTLGAGT